MAGVTDMAELVHAREDDAVVYPESDGQPMAETGIHAQWIVNVRYRLERHYTDQPDVHTGFNLLFYWVEGDPTKSISPDVYVTFGIDKAPRRTYRVWVEGKAPDVVFEITSPSTRRRDLGFKKRLYERLGVREYFLYDPLGEYLDPPLMGFRLPSGNAQGDHYRRLDGPPLTSEALDLSLELDPAGALVMQDRATGETLHAPWEWATMQQERATQEAERAEQEARRAKLEAERAERAEARVRELEALLARQEKE